jgi:ferredoxin
MIPGMIRHLTRGIEGQTETVLQQWWSSDEVTQGEWRDVPTHNEVRPQGPPICPQCKVDMSKGLGCGGCSATCPGMQIFSRLHASECEHCAAGLPVTMGTHRRGKGSPVGACTANIDGYQGAFK